MQQPLPRNVRSGEELQQYGVESLSDLHRIELQPGSHQTLRPFPSVQDTIGHVDAMLEHNLDSNESLH